MNESPLKYITTMLDKAVAESVPLEIRGRMVEVSGTMVRATIPGVRIGEMVTLRNPDGSLELKGEVVGLSGQMAVISPLGKFFGLASTTEVTSSGHVMTAPAGPEVLGRSRRAGTADRREKKGPLAASQFIRSARPPSPLKRRIIDHPVTWACGSSTEC
jgi:type III secretion protein N (ATPase)